jgi:hypothetical protein
MNASLWGRHLIIKKYINLKLTPIENWCGILMAL